MMLGHGFAEPFGGDMRVNLRGGDVGVAEHRLDAAQIGSMFDQMRGEGVAQDVRA